MLKKASKKTITYHDEFKDLFILQPNEEKTPLTLVKCTLESRQIKKVYPLGSFWYHINDQILGEQEVFYTARG